jgi:hypothetical protein
MKDKVDGLLNLVENHLGAFRGLGLPSLKSLIFRTDEPDLHKNLIAPIT